MNIDEYQKEALLTDKTPEGSEEAVLIPLLGLCGEVGTLVSEYKKKLRDGKSYMQFKDRIAEDLGDILWYLSNVASKFDMSLDEIALSNLRKTRDRWRLPDDVTGDTRLYDDDFPEEEQLPREMIIEFVEDRTSNPVRVQMFWNGEEIGDPLSDNSVDEDSYRYHDVFHLTCAAMLGWSPVLRRILDMKRKSDPSIDSIQDGARAAVLEELVSALAFHYAQSHQMLDGIGALDYSLLKTIEMLLADREVADHSLAEWEQVIVTCFSIWRQLLENGGGKISLNLLDKRIDFVE